MNHNNFDNFSQTNPEDRSSEYQTTEYVEQHNQINEQQNFQDKANFNVKTELLDNPKNDNVFAWVVVLEGARVGKIYKLRSDSSTIGRDPSCDMRIDDSSISRQHIKIRTVKNEGVIIAKNNNNMNKFILHDLATSNGTKLNGQDIIKEALKDNDRIKIGKTVLVFKQVE